MKRKHAQLKIASAAGIESALPSPSSAGAMDSLLEKLRAAAPQTRDQKDRRRRARLKDRHQVRIASGQKIPDLNEIPEVEAGLQSAKSTGSAPTDDDGNLVSPGLSSPKEAEEDDVAARAALLLQGMRGDGAEDSEEKRESLRKARRQTAQDERTARRRRMREKTASTQPKEDDETKDDAMADADVPTPTAEETPTEV